METESVQKTKCEIKRLKLIALITGFIALSILSRGITISSVEKNTIGRIEGTHLVKNGSMRSHLAKPLQIKQRVLHDDLYRSTHKPTTKSPDVTPQGVVSNPYDITVVTMYIPIGTFGKGSPGSLRTVNRYKLWMTAYGLIANKVVAFFEDSDSLQHFRSIRSRQPADRTVLIQVNRSQLPAFGDYDRIMKIFSQPGYPRFYPNTVNANYSVTVNAKYDALQMALDMGHVKTKYVAWVDIGIFRMFSKTENKSYNSFSLEVPLDFDEKRVGLCTVEHRGKLIDATPWDYVRRNLVWLAGGFVLGTQNVMKKFIKSYKNAAQKMLNANMSSTDQQVIGAMYSPDMIREQEVEVQEYFCHDGEYELPGWAAVYFCLAYKCKEAAEIRRRNRTAAGTYVNNDPPRL